MTGDPSPALEDPPVPEMVRAAGVVCWRPARDRRRDRVSTGTGGTPRPDPDLEVLLVHRPRYDDWSWPKGKLEPGESLPECAVRETAEETGARVVLGLPLATVEYPLPDGRTKQVGYWAARSLRSGTPSASAEEVDEARWVHLGDARRRLTRAGDLAPLDALAAAAAGEVLAGRPVIIVRHAAARPRDAWASADADRPLVASGRRQALALSALLRCWQPDRVVTSPWRRCLETLGPYLAASGARLRIKGGLSEDGFRRDPGKAGRHLANLLCRDAAGLLCTHRPVLPALLDVLRAAADDPVQALIPSADPYLAPGEVLVAHTVSGSRGPRVVAVERHLSEG